MRAKFDLSLVVREGSDGLSCSLTYATDLFDEADMQRLLQQYGRLLQAIVADPDRPLAVLPWLDAADQDWLCTHGTGPVLDYPHTGVHRVFEARVRQHPDRIAAVFDGEALTYAELNAEANRLARALRGRGVGPERLVALYLPRSLEQLIAVLAIWKAGGAYVPFDPAHPPGRVQAMLDDAQPIVVLTHSTLANRVPDGVPTLVLDGERVWADADTSDLDDDGTPDRLAYVLYTSGSTGTPKGVEIVHGGLQSLWVSLASALQIGDDGWSASVNAPLAFDASVQQLLQLLGGATLHPLTDSTRRDIAALWHALEVQPIDVLDATPSFVQLMLDSAPAGAHWPRTLLIGGEAISERLWQQLIGLRRDTGVRAFNVYGPTECTVDSTIAAIADELPVPVIGRPVANLRLYVLDAHGMPCPRGMAGELHVGRRRCCTRLPCAA